MKRRTKKEIAADKRSIAAYDKFRKEAKKQGILLSRKKTRKELIEFFQNARDLGERKNAMAILKKDEIKFTKSAARATAKEILDTQHKKASREEVNKLSKEIRSGEWQKSQKFSTFEEALMAVAGEKAYSHEDYEMAEGVFY